MAKRDFLYGILLLIGFVGYFFVMKAANLYENFNLRIFNIVIHAGIIYLAIRRYYLRYKEAGINYISGALAGFKPSLIAVILFGIFQVFYLQYDQALMDAITAQAPAGSYLTPITAAIVIMFEGIAVSVILSYLCMRIVDAQYYKGKQKSTSNE